MSTHISGPWTAIYRNKRWHIMAGSDNTIEIATLKGYDEDDEANARLLAAAPELLEAVQTMLGHIEEYDWQSPSYVEVTDLAKYAMARVMGRTHEGANTSNNWRVTLYEEPGDKHTLLFDCFADDSDHAIEQAESAYPGCEIINTTSLELIERPVFKEMTSLVKAIADNPYLLTPDQWASEARLAMKLDSTASEDGRSECEDCGAKLSTDGLCPSCES